MATKLLFPNVSLNSGRMRKDVTRIYYAFSYWSNRAFKDACVLGQKYAMLRWRTETLAFVAMTPSRPYKQSTRVLCGTYRSDHVTCRPGKEQKSNWPHPGRLLCCGVLAGSPVSRHGWCGVMTAENQANVASNSSSCNDAGVEYNEEHAMVEAWLDEHPKFLQDYFLRKATRNMVDTWLVTRAVPQSLMQDAVGCAPIATSGSSPTGTSSRPSSGTTTPVRKISAHEFERGGLLRPIVTTVDGTLTFIGDGISQPPPRLLRKNRRELRALDERELIFALVKDICNDLDVRSLCHKILQNVGILTNADRCSLFLAREAGSSRCLVSKLFDVSMDSTIESMEKNEFVIPWGTGIVGYVAETGESVNIPDAYKDARFNHDIDQVTGYKTRSILCMPIKDVGGEVLGVAQVINKIGLKGDEPFDENDEKVFASYLQFCGIGIRNAQIYERSQLENKRNQVLLDLARMIFEKQSTIEHVVYRIMTHTQSLLRCERCQVLLVHEASKGSFSRVFDLEENDLKNEETDVRTSPFEGRFPINIGISGHVATTGQTVNIADPYSDSRFDPAVSFVIDISERRKLCGFNEKWMRCKY
uniref:3',5'-cyclic-GMP phosphodiesterase n=1 Tax=Strigamia maritima TaxID=126957 RepID=T1JEP4_STRMM